VDYIHRLGIKKDIMAVPSLALGTPEISLYGMVSAFAVFGNNGIRCEPYFIERIEDSKGNIIYQRVPQCREVIDSRVANTLYEMMKKVVDGAYDPTTKKRSGTGVRLRYKYNLKIPIAGKTGTTQYHSDGWFIGITPDFCAGVWVGAEDRSVRFSTMTYGQGASMALPIFALFCKKVYEDTSSTKLTRASATTTLTLKDANFEEKVEGPGDEE